jgi:hypothetical protein
MSSILLASLAILFAQDGEKLPFKVLYVGNTDTPRGKEYVDLLERTFQGAKGVSRKDADAARADAFDVVLLDWSQTDQSYQDLDKVPSPLGDRAAWKKPTVLLGSAGLLLAEKWRLAGTRG